MDRPATEGPFCLSQPEGTSMYVCVHVWQIVDATLFSLGVMIYKCVRVCTSEPHCNFFLGISEQDQMCFMQMSARDGKLTENKTKKEKQKKKQNTGDGIV